MILCGKQIASCEDMCQGSSSHVLKKSHYFLRLYVGLFKKKWLECTAPGVTML